MARAGNLTEALAPGALAISRGCPGSQTAWAWAKAQNAGFKRSPREKPSIIEGNGAWRDLSPLPSLTIILRLVAVGKESDFPKSRKANFRTAFFFFFFLFLSFLFSLSKLVPVQDILHQAHAKVFLSFLGFSLPLAIPATSGVSPPSNYLHFPPVTPNLGGKHTNEPTLWKPLATGTNGMGSVLASPTGSASL